MTPTSDRELFTGTSKLIASRSGDWERINHSFRTINQSEPSEPCSKAVIQSRIVFSLAEKHCFLLKLLQLVVSCYAEGLLFLLLLLGFLLSNHPTAIVALLRLWFGQSQIHTTPSSSLPLVRSQLSSSLFSTSLFSSQNGKIQEKVLLQCHSGMASSLSRLCCSLFSGLLSIYCFDTFFSSFFSLPLSDILFFISAFPHSLPPLTHADQSGASRRARSGHCLRVDQDDNGEGYPVRYQS